MTVTAPEPSQSPDPADADRGAAMNRLMKYIAGVAGLFLLTLTAYVPAIRAGFIWDDNYYVTENQALKTFDGLQRIWVGILPDARQYPIPQYYPMTATSFWIEHHLWGNAPLGYHLINVLLHATAAWVLWVILRKLAVPGAWVIAALWAVHPLQVESVAWITERKNVLSALF